MRREVPVPAVSTADRLTQVAAGISLLILQKQIPDPRIGHRMAIQLFCDVTFDHASGGSTNTSDGVVPLKCFWLLLPDDVLQSPFDTTDHLRGRDMRFGADEELAGVAGDCDAVFEDSDVVGFGGRLQEVEPLIVCHWLLPPEYCESPVQLVRGSHVSWRADRLCSFQTGAPPA